MGKMSIRHSEVSRFSLRAVVADDPPADRKFVLNGIVQNPKPSSTDASTGKGLRFDFSSLQPKASVEASPRGKPFIAPMKNAFDVSSESSKADVMRLTIMVEDLNSRVKKASDRAAAAEVQLQRTQTALMAERNNNAARIKAVSAELASSRATESHLRSELSSAASKASKQAVKVDKFESAVASALAADKSVEESKRKLEAMAMEVSKKQEQMETMASELIEMHSQNSAAKGSISHLSVKLADAEAELKRARGAERVAVAERDAAKAKLAGALERASVAESAAEELRQISLKAEDTSCFTSSAPTEESAVSVEVAKSNDENKVPGPKYPDPVTMHKKYQGMRQAVLDLSKKIVKATHAGASESRIAELSEKRSAAYAKALKYKNRYDTIFGAVDNVAAGGSLHDVSDTAKVEAVNTTMYHIFGDPPDIRVPNFNSDAHKEASTSRFGMPLNLGVSDCAHDIGSVLLPASAFSAPVDSEEPAPTGNHDAQGDMINSVVSDLKAFLVDAKERDERAHPKPASV